MSQKNFIKENFALVMGITLPVLLMIFFVLSTMIPNKLSDPPKYNAIFAVSDYRSSGPNAAYTQRLQVKDGHLYVVFDPTQNNYMNTQWKKLYIYEVATQNLRPLDIEGPEVVTEENKGKPILVSSAQNMKIDGSLKSPDGYEFVANGYGSSGFMNDLFWGSSYRDGIYLKKGSSTVRLPQSPDGTYYYGGTEFIGWVVQ